MRQPIRVNCSYGQWKDGLLVSHEIDDPQNQLRRSKFDLDHAFQLGKLELVTITSGAAGTVVYLNASPAGRFRDS